MVLASLITVVPTNLSQQMNKFEFNIDKLPEVEEVAPSSPVDGPDLSKFSNPNYLTTAMDKMWKSFAPEQPTRKHDSTNVGKSVEKVFDKLIQAESRGKHRNAQGELTTSPVGAKGITQVMPASGRDPGYGVAPLSNDTEEEYIRFGKDLLQAYTNEFGGDIEKGLAAYNFGPGNMKKLITNHGDKWKKHLPKETSNYLNKILGKKPNG